MTLATRTDGLWTELRVGDTATDADGTRASYDTLLLWSDPERAAFGVYPVPEPDTPDDKVEIGRTLRPTGQSPTWDVTYQDVPPAPEPESHVDNPTLSDWRVALTLWKRADGTLRIDEVTRKVADLVAAGHPMGRIARERLEYANNVLRVQLMQLKDALGFTEAEVDESLQRADRVRQGDLSGEWPLPAD